MVKQHSSDSDKIIPMADEEQQPKAPRRTGRIMAVANQKGGVGKTTTTINLASAMAAVNRRVLVVDMDPQGNASTGLGVEPADGDITTYDILLDPKRDWASEPVVETSVPNLFIYPATMNLAGVEVELVGAVSREARLKQVLANVRYEYDLVLIDCPPSLSILTVNALVAADEVLVPVQCEYFALEGLSHLFRTIERVRIAYNSNLTMAGIVLTMFDKRNRLDREVVADVRRTLSDVTFETMIPRNVRVSEAPSYGKPVMFHAFNSPGAQAYVHLAGEMMRRERQLATGSMAS